MFHIKSKKLMQYLQTTTLLCFFFPLFHSGLSIYTTTTTSWFRVHLLLCLEFHPEAPKHSSGKPILHI